MLLAKNLIARYLAEQNRLCVKDKREEDFIFECVVYCLSKTGNYLTTTAYCRIDFEKDIEEYRVECSHRFFYNTLDSEWVTIH